jgi:pyroglutamyl-peptidase
VNNNLKSKIQNLRSKILLTSFKTWLPHQKSNSSDDLLAYLQQQAFPDAQLTFLRQLPVNIPQASQQTISMIQQAEPDIIICCGMAESRQKLTVESNAIYNGQQIKTKVDLEQLICQLSYTKISHDAGKFVCEGLYYQILAYLQQHQPSRLGIFVHVPILHQDNHSQIVNDFHQILSRITGKLI